MWSGISSHHFATVGHTAANANWSHASESIGRTAAFIAGQFGVFGPILMAAYLWGAWRAFRSREDRAGRLLLCFSAPPLLIITVQSFISDANANWAAAAYVAAAPLAVHTILAAWGRWGIRSAAALHALVLAAVTAFAVSPAAVEAAGLANAYKRFHGWRALGQEVVVETRGGAYEAVVVPNRSLIASLLYYARPLGVPILAWDDDATPENHFQMTLRLDPAMKGRVLLLTDSPHPEKQLATFARARLTRTVAVPIGGHRVRRTNFFAAEGYRGVMSTAPSSQ